jgi:hypothetical protein
MNNYTLNAFVAGATTINGITDQRADPKFEETLLRGNGGFMPTFSAMLKQEPLLGFTTLDISTALGVTTTKGASVSTAVLWFQPLTNQGQRGTSGLKLTAANGLIVPKTLKASQGKEATLEVDLYAISADGTTAPLIAGTGTVAAGGGVDALFTLGPVTIGGTAIGGIQELSIDFGIKVIVRSSDGQIYPTFACVDEMRPKLTIKTTDIAKADAYMALGGSAAVVATLLGVTNGAGLSGTNLVLTTTGGRLHGSTSGGDEQSGEIVHMPVFDGTNDILALS